MSTLKLVCEIATERDHNHESNIMFSLDKKIVLWDIIDWK